MNKDNHLIFEAYKDKFVDAMGKYKDRENERDEKQRDAEQSVEGNKNEDTKSKFSRKEPLVKQVKMLTNTAIRAVFAAIESMDNLDSIPYDGELDSFVMNLDEEVERLIDVLKQKMPDTQNSNPGDQKMG